MPSRSIFVWITCWLLVGLACQVPNSLPKVQTPQAQVFIFLDTDCPISRQMCLYIRQLAARYDAHIVAIQLVFQHRASRAQIRDFLSTFDLPLPYTVNSHYALSRQMGASITPEALLYDAQQILRYRGAINDLYTEIGVKRPEPSYFFLQANIDSLLLDKALPYKAQKAIGCLIE